MAYAFKDPLKVDSVSTDIRNLGDLAGEMVYRLPGCADLMIRKELQRTWSDFATRTRCLKIPFKIELVQGKNKYAVPLVMDAAIDRLTGMHLALEKDGTVDHQDVRRFFDEEWNFLRTIDFQPMVFLNKRIDAAFLRKRNRLYGIAECFPRIGSEEIPGWIYDRFGRAIVEGAMKNLFSMSGKPWSDPAQAQTSLIVYENALNDAVMNDMEDNRGEVDVTYREGWA